MTKAARSTLKVFARPDEQDASASAPQLSSCRVPSGARSEIGQKERNDQRVGQIDEKGTHQRHDDEGQMRGPIALRHRGHVGHRGGGRAQRDPTEAGADHRGVVVAPHGRKDHEQVYGYCHRELNRQDGEDRPGQVDQGPQLHTHQ